MSRRAECSGLDFETWYFICLDAACKIIYDGFQSNIYYAEGRITAVEVRADKV
jgi:hypothetical protein